MEIRKLISKFLTSIVEKNYAKANNDLKQIVEAKVTERVKEVAEKQKGEKGKKKTASKSKTASKGKLSKEENKEKFLKMIKSKKVTKKGKK